MPLMNWDASLDIGVRSMNDEHVELLRVMNEIYDARQAGMSGASMNALVAELGRVCVKHFADEEAYMQKIGFPGLSRHKLLHKDLLDRYADLAQKIKDADGKVGDNFFDFLKFWLTSHIRGVDIKYGEHSKTLAHA